MAAPDGDVRSRLVEYTERVGARALEALERFVRDASAVPNDRFLRTEGIPWIEHLEANWKTIRAELDDVLVERELLPNFQDISTDQGSLTEGDDWKTFFLYGFGFRSEPNCARCPNTAALVETIPGMQTAFFSILAPGKHVPLHRGITKGMVRAHLGLRVPQSPEDCWMTCGDEKIVWREGDLVFFDDTYPHAVWNNTNEERAVLLFDFERPMTRGGQRVSRLMMWVLRHTAYFKDAQRNQRDWEQRYREFLAQPPC
jgi:beta-hydroxylase